MLARVLRNVGLLTGAQLAARVLNFVLLAALARIAGSDGAGAYATAVSVALGFLLLSDLGLSPRLIREASARPDEGGDLYRETLGLKLLLLVPAGLAIGVGVLWLPYPAQVRELVGLMGVAALLQSLAQANEGLLRARERMQWEALGGLLQSGLTTGLAVWWLASGWGLLWVGVARIVGVAAHLLLLSAVLRQEIRFAPPGPGARASLRAALPYMSTASMNLAYGQIDIVLLSLVATQSQVGEYALISRIVLVAGTFASTGAAALLPTLARAFTEAKARFRRLALAVPATAAVLGGFGTGGLAILGGPVLTLAYGDEFAPLTPLFTTATGYVLLRFLTAALGVVLTAAGRQATRALCIFLGLMATLAFILLWVPTHGVAGAVDALVGSELVLLACLAAAAARFASGWSRS